MYTLTIEGHDIRDYLHTLIEQVENNPLIHVYKNARIKDIEGYVGNYRTQFRTETRPSSSARANKKHDHKGRNIRSHESEVKNKKDRSIETHESKVSTNESDVRSHASDMRNHESVISNNKPEVMEIEHGVIIVATGAQESVPKEYAYGKDRRVMTLLEFEKWLSSEQPETPNPKSVVMIQCVGSREADHPYCSRVCCTGAIKNALSLKEKHPETDVFILYRDVRTYGTKEKYGPYETAARGFCHRRGIHGRHMPCPEIHR